MPIVRIAGRLVLFAHVPRCGGTSVAHYLAARFGPLAFADAAFHDRPGPARWTRTSPQHATAADLGHLFPDGFFAASFAMVRHPVARLQSVFRFQRDVEGRIGRQVRFDAWLEKLAGLTGAHPFVMDNHARPMDEMVPAAARAFRLEDGFAPLVAWLDGLAGTAAPDLAVPRKNDHAERVAWAGLRTGPEPEVTAAARAILADRYGRDFDRFGYDPGDREDRR